MLNAATNPPLFRTGWFVKSLASETLVVFVIRTAGNPFKGRPSWRLLIGVVAVSLAGAALPYTRLGALMGFTPLPLPLLGVISLLALTYLFLSPACVALTRRLFRPLHSLQKFEPSHTHRTRAQAQRDVVRVQFAEVKQLPERRRVQH